MKLAFQQIERLRKKAMQSKCNQKVAAMGFNAGGELVYISMNTSIYHNGQSRRGLSVHAEEHIFKVAKRKNIKDIVICRVGNSGDFLPIDPCESCAKTAEKLGIRIYSVLGSQTDTIKERC